MDFFKLFVLVSAIAGVLGGRITHEDIQHELAREEKTNNAMKIDTVSDLDLDAFLGRWYQMYGSVSSTILTFGNAGPQDLCTSADYTLNEDGSTIDVLNQGIRLDGRVTKIWGTARKTDEPGQRKLSFSKFMRGTQEVQPPDFEGDYWIYSLGPIVNGRYEYAIVGGPAAPKWGLDKTQLFVLARNPKLFEETYDDKVHEWLKENSFSWWWNKPRKTGSIGKWHWFPYPSFSDGSGDRGAWGQDGCATVEGLDAPVDGSADPRN
eukprot:TRINITY_DN38721_c0_g1_i2.p1 TRINITY_DN38721_c0_g1~~TRINITY_DN38721_c0_g1_i2.p1  ORF type:complete len:264 (+),score=38.90 TRINITY_DN38721_c0_g1_i2:70-861(+)